MLNPIPLAQRRSVHVRNGSRGFSIIELMVVVSIIVVLISLLLPALGRARETARVAACAAELRQVAIGVMNYGKDNGNWGLVMPKHIVMKSMGGQNWYANQLWGGGFTTTKFSERGNEADWNMNCNPGSANETSTNCTVILAQKWFAIPYMNADRDLPAMSTFCPSMGRDGTKYRYAYNRPPNWHANSSYALNHNIANTYYDKNNPGNPDNGKGLTDGGNPARFVRAKLPSQTMMATEGVSNFTIYRTGQMQFPHYATDKVTNDGYDNPMNPSPYDDYASQVNGKANVLYIDGSVRLDVDYLAAKAGFSEHPPRDMRRNYAFPFWDLEQEPATTP